MALERGQHGPLGQLDALDQRLQAIVGRIFSLLGDGCECALEIVGDLQHVAGKSRDGVALGVADLAGGAAAQVFHVGRHPQALVLELLDIGQ